MSADDANSPCPTCNAPVYGCGLDCPDHPDNRNTTENISPSHPTPLCKHPSPICPCDQCSYDTACDNCGKTPCHFWRREGNDLKVACSADCFEKTLGMTIYVSVWDEED